MHSNNGDVSNSNNKICICSAIYGRAQVCAVHVRAKDLAVVLLHIVLVIGRCKQQQTVMGCFGLFVL